MFHHYEVAGLRGGNSLVLDTILQRPATTVPAYLCELVAQP
jgi:hypothetical protein